MNLQVKHINNIHVTDYIINRQKYETQNNYVELRYKETKEDSDDLKHVDKYWDTKK